MCISKVEFRFGSNAGHSRTLSPNEKVYVTDVLVTRDAVQLELHIVDATTLADVQGTRDRAELNVKLPGLDTSLDSHGGAMS